MNPLETLLAATGELAVRFHLHRQGIEHYRSQRVWKVEPCEGAAELGEGNSLGTYGQFNGTAAHNVIRPTQK
jgi:hypothetical protein